MSEIDALLKSLEPRTRAELERIRSIAKSLLPDSEEVIAYDMPTIRYKATNIIGFDARKNHIGIYPYSGQVISEIEELKNYDTAKGAIREKLNNPLPDDLIKKIIRLRLKQAGFNNI